MSSSHLPPYSTHPMLSPTPAPRLLAYVKQQVASNSTQENQVPFSVKPVLSFLPRKVLEPIPVSNSINSTLESDTTPRTVPMNEQLPSPYFGNVKSTTTSKPFSGDRLTKSEIRSQKDFSRQTLPDLLKCNLSRPIKLDLESFQKLRKESLHEAKTKSSLHTYAPTPHQSVTVSIHDFPMLERSKRTSSQSLKRVSFSPNIICIEFHKESEDSFSSGL